MMRIIIAGSLSTSVTSAGPLHPGVRATPGPAA